MNQADEHTFKRATTSAVLGFAMQVVLLIVVGLLGGYAQARGIHAAAWYLAGGLPLWIILWMLYNQYRLERLESLETEALAKDSVNSALFAEADQQLSLARSRLEKLNKYGLNIVSVAMAIYYLAMGGWLLSGTMRLAEFELLKQQSLGPDVNLGPIILVLSAVGFVAFLLGRYLAGMTDVKQWLALRAGAACLMGAFIVTALIAIAAAVTYAVDDRVFLWLTYVIPVFMIVIGIEILLALFFGLYRPRRADEFVRPAFDSRLTGWLARPESIGKIISDTVNYQFGFEISQSWFYQLMFKALMPLVLTCIILVIAMTSIVIVEPQQKAVIMNWGAFDRVVEPGLRFKWPWPKGSAELYDVDRVHQTVVGSSKMLRTDVPLLWTNAHGEGAEEYLVTAPSQNDQTVMTSKVAAGELIGASVFVKYRIDDLEQYVSSADSPDKVLILLADRNVSAYFATRTIDALLASERGTASNDLFDLISNDVEASGIGLKVLFVSVSGVHPPQDSEVADKFLEVIGAYQDRQTNIEYAKRDAVTILAAVAGADQTALQISKDIESLSAQRRDFEADDGKISADEQRKLDEATVAIEELLDAAGGEAAQSIFAARAYRWSRAISELAKTERFASELEAYRKAPRYYRMRQYLDTLASTMRSRRKIILDTNEAGVSPTIRLDMIDKRSAISAMFDEE